MKRHWASLPLPPHWRCRAGASPGRRPASRVTRGARLARREHGRKLGLAGMIDDVFQRIGDHTFLKVQALKAQKQRPSAS